MSTPHRRRALVAAALLAVGTLVAALLNVTLAGPASAHGSVVDPASRNYGCWQRWGSDFQNPAMATQDPMCWQAWQADPNAMWNWNGLFREGVAGNHQAAIPDGQLCSAGHTSSGRYNALDAVGAWKTAPVTGNFKIKLYDQASHGADYIRVYVTKQGFDALTTPLRWSDLELAGQIGNTPASQWTPESTGVSIQVPASAPGRTGRHIVYTIWQASHLDQSYYLCSDVDFGGGGPSPTTSPTTGPSPTTSPTTGPTPTSSPTGGPTPSTPPTTPNPAGGCTATYRITGQWNGGFQAEVQVTNGGSPVRGWSVSWNYQNGQQVGSAWNATVSTNGTLVTARNVAYNGTLAPGASTGFGFVGSSGATNPVPGIVSCTTVA
ncbi:lytic polysaccharide monooxygenase auxiliary activity family 9 protein [Micromonospora auratinigra]|uniref:Chitin-binding protein n=1 Tax=Micromonospora auratinigra TaxID=261654 RepID=A0A1A8YZ60_9ACTN|nr:lytic polysaccharide monooxygenase [Micromonospora auratinigra]SBT36889.1 chitin-binding protein [Micromonospora auratinigra]